ncbi:NADH:ubiquinone oxidoreductase 41 kd complex i subunit [Rhodobacteraceae bacterium HTCC2083]|jgi:predicted flap endonuclease-1-like 5' DNA nuclease|nr:NADH:ubiquinone oxidoreductase 41 kd complex i subunit [Rhodobacteraceae bacterium HTCC2083]
MSDLKKKSSCQVGCWAMAAAAGVLTFIMLSTIGDYSFLPAVVLGILIFGLLGLLFNWLFCAPLPAAREKTDLSAASADAASTSTSASSASNAGAATVTRDSAAADKAAVEAKAQAAADKKAKVAADKKAKAAADKKASDKKTKADEKAAKTKADADQKAADKKAKAAKTKAYKTAAAKAEADAKAGEDFDGDDVREAADEGTKPATLAAAREGGADDLKRIKGIGPKLEKLCNTMGFFHFDQIAAWTPDEMAWVNANLEGFKGRATRDKWIDQAKLLAAGKETEFSKRVDKGSVY